MWDKVNIRGTVETDPHTCERYIDPYPGYPTQVCGTMEVKPVGMGNWPLGGNSAGLQSGVTGGEGLNTIGLLVTVWGRVIDVGVDYFIIDDGYLETVKCVVRPGDTVPSVDDMVSVTGISSCEEYGGELRRVILRRTKLDTVIW